jgi:hypothetical protein
MKALASNYVAGFTKLNLPKSLIGYAACFELWQRSGGSPHLESRNFAGSNAVTLASYKRTQTASLCIDCHKM